MGDAAGGEWLRTAHCPTPNAYSLAAPCKVVISKFRNVILNGRKVAWENSECTRRLRASLPQTRLLRQTSRVRGRSDEAETGSVW